MAVPKSKISKSKTNSRFANWKISAPGLVECPQCHTSLRTPTRSDYASESEQSLSFIIRRVL